MAGTQASELGSFLRSRRTALEPETVGIRVEGVRRTTGLRRAELARLAGVSPGYYTRLEQGRAPHPSPSVLAALANALRLSADERGICSRSAATCGCSRPSRTSCRPAPAGCWNCCRSRRPPM
ncbi:helix-turn-helix domain-containing protein [Nocardia africana]|uniref:Helix-turn-helix domain-containing protein n=1 Tax=Nocardia africana TaxID=134964 RepID=A0ABW6NDR9_9NOCA